jgi:glyoxylase-like metal-dependent hydrolase (beta-lactamase superfamily II)
MRPRLAFAALLAISAATPAAAQAPPAAAPSLALWRLDCGRLEDGEARPSPWRKEPLPIPCFLVRHGARYLLWDAGLSARALGNAHPQMKLDRTVSDQLAQIGVKPEQVEFVAISHYHGDHTGQASQFPKARLLIGAADLAALKSTPLPEGAAPSHLAPWIEGGAPVDALIEDKDVFGDGRVVVLMTPGHTPGHLALLVKLAGGNVMISGDLWDGHGNVLTDDMPAFNTSRAETAASRERFRRLAYKLDATVILQHEIDDVAKLPLFPKAAS